MIDDRLLFERSDPRGNVIGIRGRIHVRIDIPNDALRVDDEGPAFCQIDQWHLDAIGLCNRTRIIG